MAKDPRFERLPCMHKGIYADDCLVNRVQQVNRLHSTFLMIIFVAKRSLQFLSSAINMFAILLAESSGIQFHLCQICGVVSTQCSQMQYDFYYSTIQGPIYFRNDEEPEDYLVNSYYFNRVKEGGLTFSVTTTKCWNHLPVWIRASLSVNITF